MVILLKVRKAVKGCIILGLNPRRSLDADHEQFLTDIARQSRELMAKLTIDEDTQKREEQLMADLSETERRIKRLAEIAPAGLYEMAADGSLHWANSEFFEIFGIPHERRDASLFNWTDYILPEDHEQANEKMTRSLIEAVEITDSLRLKTRWKPPGPSHDQHFQDEESWIMYSASPDIAQDGTVQSLMGSLMDISHLKWAEQLQIRNAESARRDKERHEEFIDVTSHEMRNPLSAITQCADNVKSSLQAATRTNDSLLLMEIVKLNVEAADSILFCVAHQRRIIDDILTLGKLDSGLLAISPAAFRPSELVEQCLKMFTIEFEVNKIMMRTQLDDMLAMTHTSSVLGDSSRLLQILVNLLTNAIKFTSTETTREITIRIGLSTSVVPTSTFGADFEWHPTGKIRPDLTLESEYGPGEVIYLYCAVTDSGRGIARASGSKLFSKFEQADRRTHTKYGGSGLGLFISRELTELQGGQIGFSSEVGVGSTFAFYTKVKLPVVDVLSAVHASGPDHPITEITRDVSGKVSGTTPPPAKFNVLLVEDNLLNQRLLAKQLEKQGCIVQVANNGGEAVDIVLRMYGLPVEYSTSPPENTPSYFDCILMDWEMPVCNGIKATIRIREIEKQQSSKRNIIIGITANARAKQIEIAMEAEMDTVVTKPFRVAELLARIHKCVMTTKDRA